MSLFSWALVGLTVGLVSGLVTNGCRIVEDTIVATVGAVIGGWLFVTLTGGTVTMFTVVGTLAALASSVLLLLFARGLGRGRSTI
jgi:uncharacterized membrane protein YeaQ/YmgE (transglycosylase-associated protein family)